MTRLPLRPLLLSLLLAGGLAVGQAQAQDGVCRGKAPEVGATLKGPVLHVIDGERLCVALGPATDQWVEVQVSDASLQKASAGKPARGSLMAAAFARNAACSVTGIVDGRAVAACRIEDRPLAETLGQPDIVRIGQAWR